MCEILFLANDVTNNALWRGCNNAIIEDLEIFGDEEFLLSRMRRVLWIFTFDSFKDDTIFAQMSSDCPSYRT